MVTTHSPAVGFAAPQQPPNYLQVLQPTLFARLFAPRHRGCDGRLIPIARRGSFLIRECTTCGTTVRDFA